jgi:hypothetical protein
VERKKINEGRQKAKLNASSQADDKSDHLAQILVSTRRISRTKISQGRWLGEATNAGQVMCY